MLETKTSHLHQASPIAEALLDWYDRHARRLPWRIGPAERRSGAIPAPYHVWLSEVMLQQTQVATVRDYFLRFTERWPSIRELALAGEADVMAAWAGLGYYSRARNLKKCAETVWFDFNGDFPETPDELRKLPGIGEYTANAIAAIAFDYPAVVVDGNIERVTARLMRIHAPLPGAKKDIHKAVGEFGPSNRPGDFAQAMMDLGATICTPKKPACALCPLDGECAAHRAGEAELLPVKAPKAKKPRRKGAVFVAQQRDGSVLLRRRPPSGLLGGMSEPPTTDWNARSDGLTGQRAAPFEAAWREAGSIRHVFTHFELTLEVWLAELDGSELLDGVEGWWSSPADLPGEALPTVMKKAITSAIPQAFKRTTS